MIEHNLTLKHYVALALLGLGVGISSIQPLEWEAYVLYQIGTVIMLLVLIICLKKIGLSFANFCLYLGFLIIHVIGAHYLYSYVPYNDWFIK